MEGDTGKGVEGSSNGGDSSPQRGGLPAGAIAGIVITVLVLAALTVFLVRKRVAANRQSRSRSWKDNLFSKGISSEKYNAGGAGYGREEGVGGTITPYAFTPQPQTQHKSTPSKSIPRVPVPAMPTTVVPTHTDEWPRSPPVVNGRTVVSTFIPSLPDEMSISMGETVRVLAEYDDGWALCMNGRGEQGMVPLECLGQDNSTRQAYVARDPSVAWRASSLSGWGSVRRMATDKSDTPTTDDEQRQQRHEELTATASGSSSSSDSGHPTPMKPASVNFMESFMASIGSERECEGALSLAALQGH
ncbi:SH3 domain-containing protein [Salix suchowensis]|nr:SH3 domain-containing protein [Salix suchowensis]